jgi:hypothetical protein
MTLQAWITPVEDAFRDQTGQFYPTIEAALEQALENARHYRAIAAQLPPGYALDFLIRDVETILASGRQQVKKPLPANCRWPDCDCGFPERECQAPPSVSVVAA